jgi:hypothetical protein
MDYSECLIKLAHLQREVHDALLEQQWEHAHKLAQQITVESRLLQHAITLSKERGW